MIFHTISKEQLHEFINKFITSQSEQDKKNLYHQFNRSFDYNILKICGPSSEKSIRVQFIYTPDRSEIRISQGNSILDRFCFDPMDNTIIGSISVKTASLLKEYTVDVVDAICAFLKENLGAKELLLFPKDFQKENVIPAAKHNYKRARYIIGEQLQSLLEAEYKGLEALQNNIELVFGMKNIANQFGKENVYPELNDFINNNANYSPAKMQEYKDEEIAGMRARFNNPEITPLVIYNPEDHSLIGVARILKINDDIAYLSDETIANDEILEKVFPLNRFISQEDRARFVLGYLLLNAIAYSQCKEIYILANPNCVERYDSLGLKAFKGDANENLFLCFGAPQPLLKLIQGASIYNHEQAMLLSRVREARLNQLSLLETNNNIAPQLSLTAK